MRTACLLFVVKKTRDEATKLQKMGLNISMPKCGGKQGGREHGAGVRWFFTRCQGTQWDSKPQIPTPWPSGLWGVKGYSGDGAGDDRTCSLTVNEASWGCTASVSMVSRRRWERAQTFHMLQVENTGGFVIDTVSSLGGHTLGQPRVQSKPGLSHCFPAPLWLYHPPLSHSVLAPAAIQCTAELANALLPCAMGRHAPPQGRL